MPNYDYRCNACGHELELFQSMSERPKRKCPACGKQRLERLIGMGGGVLFKGGGFYQTDYRSRSYQDGAKAEQKSPSTDGPADGASKGAPAKPRADGTAPQKPSKPASDDA
jgi:putative FmdB family regulatory protein